VISKPYTTGSFFAIDAMKSGAVDFVRKPTTPEILRAAVQAALSRRVKSNLATSTSAFENAKARPRIETITLNGFEIIRPSDLGAILPAEPQERIFIIRSPEGKEYKVVVTNR